LILAVRENAETVSSSFFFGRGWLFGGTHYSAEIMTASEVKSYSSIDRFLVVFHSPTGMAETGLLARRSEKTGRVSRCEADTKHFLWCGLTVKISELARISRDPRGTTSGFLCTSDYMAERVGFDNRELCYLSPFEEHQP
jgi:hypothetical protein